MATNPEQDRVTQFEKRLGNHNKVRNFFVNRPLYFITLDAERVLTILLTDSVQVDDNIFYDEGEGKWVPGEHDGSGHWITHPYVIGQNDVSDILESFGDGDLACIVTVSQYNQYTSTAKVIALDSG